MPLREWRCVECGAEREVLVLGQEHEEISPCHYCGGRMRRVQFSRTVRQAYSFGDDRPRTAEEREQVELAAGKVFRR